MVDSREVPYDKHCEATGVLLLDSVYNQGVNYWLQVYIDECRYKEVESPEILMLSNEDDCYCIFKKGVFLCIFEQKYIN